MDRIYKFDEFISIFEEKNNISNRLFHALARGIPKIIINKWLTSPEFGGIYIRSSKSNPGLKEIFYKWEGIEKKFQNVFYKNGKIIPDPSLNIAPGDNSFWNNILNPIEEMIKKSFEMYPVYTSRNWEKFKTIIEDLPIVKAIRSKGIKFTISKSDLIYGDASFVIKFPGVSPSIFSSLEEPSKEDLEFSVLMNYSNYITEIAKKEGVPNESIKKIISILSTKDGINDPAYKEEYNKIIKEFPIMILYLVEPFSGKKDDENKELIKGAKIIGRSDVFSE